MTKTEVATLGSMIKEAVAEIQARLLEIRNAVAALKAEREAVESAPVTKALALSRLDAKLEAEAAKFDADGTLIDRLWRPDLADEPLGLVEMFISEHHASHNIEAMLAALFGTQIRKTLTARIDAEYAAIAKQGVEPMGDEQRAERLHQIDNRIAELEVTEESIRVEASFAGLDLAPRPDISAEAFLELEED